MCRCYGSVNLRTSPCQQHPRLTASADTMQQDGSCCRINREHRARMRSQDLPSDMCQAEHVLQSNRLPAERESSTIKARSKPETEHQEKHNQRIS
jgi:hypothetical protein